VGVKGLSTRLPPLLFLLELLYLLAAIAAACANFGSVIDVFLLYGRDCPPVPAPLPPLFYCLNCFSAFLRFLLRNLLENSLMIFDL
jgi:hypothetical protein